MHTDAQRAISYIQTDKDQDQQLDKTKSTQHPAFKTIYTWEICEIKSQHVFCENRHLCSFSYTDRTEKLNFS